MRKIKLHRIIEGVLIGLVVLLIWSGFNHLL